MSSPFVRPDPALWVDPPADGPAFAARLQIADEAMKDLDAYAHALSAANGRMNLVGPSALAQFWPRHVFDSAQLRLITPDVRRFIDIGSGAGFPGIVLAILLKAEGGHVHLVESQAKKCGFLQTLVSELRLPATVHHARAESGPSLIGDVVTARACAPLSRLLGFAQAYLKPGVRGLFLKGRNVDAELAEARRVWRFEATLHQSLSDPAGRIVAIERLSRA